MSTLKLVQEELIGFHSKREISWTWNTETEVFTIDSVLIRQYLMINKEITTIEDFLSLFSSEDQKRIVSLLKSVYGDEKTKPVKACIATEDASVSLSVVTAIKVSEGLIAGSLMPLFLSPTQEDLSTFFHQLFENEHHGMLITDGKTRIVACNSLFEKTSGYRIDELVGKKTSIFNAGKHGPTYFEEMWAKIEQNGFWSGLILSKRKSGIVVPEELLIQRITSIRGNIYYLGMTVDLSDTPYRIAGIEHGGIELLTQLPSDNDYYLRVKSTFTSKEETQGLMVISFVPNFESDVEFEYKKQLANAFDRENKNIIAGFLKASVFSIAILYERCPDKPHSLSIYEAIRSCFNDIKIHIDAIIYKHISQLSIGVSVLGMDAASPSRLISHSLKAMYEKHSSGSNHICFYNRTLHEKVKRRDSLEAIVVDSIKHNKIEVYFQPIICTDNWKVTKLEALCRFRDGENNILNTEEMVRIAEDLDLVAQLDLVVAESALKTRDLLMQKFGTDVELSINISLNSKKSIKAILGDLINMCRGYSQHIPYTIIELTETAYFNSENEDAEQLSKLREIGFRVAIDDFGTGYSSFSYLKNNNFDILKIDREFVKDLVYGTSNYHIVKMITSLAHTLNVQVVAEGVENLSEVVLLGDLKVDYLQGYYFEKPLPFDKLQPNINYVRKLNDFKEVKSEAIELIAFPPTLSPGCNLGEVREIFSNTNFTTLPVIVDDKCVGYLTREIFNLHASTSLGTATETMQDYRSLSKPVSAMMDAKFVEVHKTVGLGEIHEKIKNKNKFPWIAIDDSGEYFGLVDALGAIQFINEQ